MRVVVIGAGPAGLTAAYELLTKGSGYEVIVLEETGTVGGISRTVDYKGNRMDMGGHRFFTKIPEVDAWWHSMLPMQGAMPWDDRALGRRSRTKEGGPDPEAEDNVMLMRSRVSRILFDDRFYDYPVSLKVETIRNMGIAETIKVCLSYLTSVLHKKQEDNLENFYINRFGKELYKMFFENYTENLWGRHPSEIDASWGAQRVKGLSISAVLGDIFGKLMKREGRKVETSLIEEFQYPKFGPGQLWEVVAEKVRKLGGTIELDARVTSLDNGDGVIRHVSYEKDGASHTLSCGHVVSSMPIKDLVGGLKDVPAEKRAIADGLPYRDYITLGVLVKRLKLKNETKLKTVGGIVPDCWVYVQDRRVKMGRFQIYNNWSPYMVRDLENTVWLGLEYFVDEGDRYWNMSEEEFSRFGVEEMLRLGLIESAEDIIDTHMEKVKKAYPAYFDTYNRIGELTAWLNRIDNLYCIGRNGQHRYNNIDHSMCTAFEAVKNILNGVKDKDNIWNVNTEQAYHEEKESIA